MKHSTSFRPSGTKCYWALDAARILDACHTPTLAGDALFFFWTPAR
jgi:hypothetical protein